MGIIGMQPMTTKAIFLDRDGVLVEDRGYTCKFSEADVFSFAVAAVRLMNEHHYKVIIVTNQSAVARGICSENQVLEMHRQLKEFFAERGAAIDDFYYSPYHEDGVIERYKKKHESRKPSPGMILQAAHDHHLDLSRCFLIGDNECDILAGQNAGCRSILVLTGKGRQVEKELERKNIIPYTIAVDVLAAVEDIIRDGFAHSSLNRR